MGRERPPHFAPLGMIPLGFLIALIALVSADSASAQTGTVNFIQSGFSVNANQSNAVITVVFSGSTDGVATVDYATSDGTGMAGVDYVTTTGTLVFAAEVLSTNIFGMTNSVVAVTNTFNVPILDAGLSQSTQTVNLALLNPTGQAVLGTPSTAVLTIINTDTQSVEFAQSAYTVNEGDSSVDITLVRTGGTNGTVSVDFSTSDGTAKAGTDYTTTDGTVTFADGVLTNTITIPILESDPLVTNQTVNLTLANPVSCAVGRPNRAVLTIIATGPPVLQFSAPEYKFHEHVGRATLTVIRFGDTSGSASINYNTSDGTAQSGVDYFGTSGTLVFGTGIDSASLSFEFVEFKTFQSNKTVNVTLSGVAGADLGTQSTAVVTIINDRTQTITFTNGNGDVVSMILQRAGVIETSTDVSPLNLVLDETDASTTITVKVKKSRTGTGLVQVGTITGAGDCRSINAPSFDLVGSGIQIGGHIAQLALHDVLDGAAITIGGAATDRTQIRAHNIDDGTVIDSTARIQNLQAARLGAVTVAAPTIGAISLRGDKRGGIPGDCDAVLTISGDGISPAQFALGSLRASGAMSNVNINVANGNIGSVAANEIIDSTIYVGFTPTDPSSPLLGGTFVSGEALRSLSVRSRTNGFGNNYIIASVIGGVNLASVITDNGGVPFGVLANQSISSVTVGSPKFKWTRTGATDQSLGDFHVIQQ